jgi:substrate import-associated zinc metallohydrolase lipoprotein
MTRKIVISLIAIVALGTLAACSEDEQFEPSIFDTASPARTELDTWIYTNYTLPHNIKIDYKWEYIESDLSRNLTPPKEDQVEGIVKMLKKVWIEPYIEIAGLDFFNSLTPKQISLIGSEAWNSTGSRTVGTAEGGRKIVLYEVDHFNTANKDRLVRYMKTIHHEFSHICNQVKNYDPEFEQIAIDGYRGADWINESDQVSYNKGFITPYATASPNEDFAEMVGIMLTHTYAEWNNILNTKPTAESGGREILRQKEEMVVNYYKSVWGFDIFKLQEELEIAVNGYISNPSASSASY